MFEYWFHGLEDSNGTYTHHGTTHDFLEVCSQIAQLIGPIVAGNFVAALLADREKELAFLRVVEWKFEFTTKPHEDEPEQKIILHKLR
jgi:hypothetical protein